MKKCRVCKKKITMMVSKGTGFCSPACKKKEKAC